ncbi:MAG TPA: hypothetical protein VMW57_05695 [Methyloceanibacter sp.]|nr:hypothetical protein [Methyloceanibacter sp.]
MAGEPALRNPKTPAATVAAPMDAARAAKITAAAIVVIAFAFGLWYAQTAILLTFAGILFVIVLYGASRELAELTGLPRLLMLTIVTLAGAAGLILAACTAGPTLMAQLAQSIAVGANQLIFGAVFGLVGLALATPLAAVATVPLRHVFRIGEDGNDDQDAPRA